MLTRPTFTPVRLREGYDMGQVDQLIDRIFATVEGRDSVTPDGVRNARFTPVRLREGYDMGEVDQWLSVAVVELSGGSATAAEPPAPTPPVGTPAAPTTHTSPGGGVNAVLVVALVAAIAVIVFLLVR